MGIMKGAFIGLSVQPDARLCRGGLSGTPLPEGRSAGVESAVDWNSIYAKTVRKEREGKHVILPANNLKSPVKSLKNFKKIFGLESFQGEIALVCIRSAACAAR